MKLFITLKNERGGKKSTSDDTRILAELSYKNQIIGEIGLYSIRDEGQDLGYRIVFYDQIGGIGKVIKEKEQKIKDEKLCKHCNKPVYEELNYCYEHRPNL